MSVTAYSPGDSVTYVPYHAHGDRAHVDCEHGIVTSVNDSGVIFVRFGARQYSQGCNADQLVSRAAHLGMIAIDSPRGVALGFTSRCFTADSYLWQQEGRILISLITSRRPGNFRALVAAIHAEGLDVAVPTPLGRMRQIVEKCSYRRALEVDAATGDACEVWTLPVSACAKADA